MYRHGLAAVALVVCTMTNLADAGQKNDPPKVNKEVRHARQKGLDWLTKNQAANGSWGKRYTIAVTSWGCLAYLSAEEEPFKGKHSKALMKSIRFLLAQQNKGQFKSQGHSWIHGQGFATLALAEVYGRSLLCKTKPDIDLKKIRKVVSQAVDVIAKNQSASGGWWYTPGNKTSHEGSTTVCAVQALVSAKNHGIPIKEKALDLGFEYLKKCQNDDGGFDYRLGDAVSMKEGTAAAVATLGLMQKFDYTVMIKGYQFLNKITPKTISKERFPYYGHFYGTMGMHLLWQEYKVDKNFREKTQGYISGVQKDLISWQAKDGTWPVKQWVKSSGGENAGYSTAFATLTLYIPEARLSIYNREPPKLPKKGE